MCTRISRFLEPRIAAKSADYHCFATGLRPASISHSFPKLWQYDAPWRRKGIPLSGQRMSVGCTRIPPLTASAAVSKPLPHCWFALTRSCSLSAWHCGAEIFRRDVLKQIAVGAVKTLHEAAVWQGFVNRNMVNLPGNTHFSPCYPLM